MKIFVIKDEENKSIAYLFYYEKSKKFYIELSNDSDEWNTPLLLSSFLKKGEKSINSYWSEQWVKQRIIPTDRQNLGSILKDNNLEEYDEYKLLVMNHGRCSQDDYYIVEIKKTDLPKEYVDRNKKRIENVIALNNYELLVTFRSSEIKKYNVLKYQDLNKKMLRILNSKELFELVKVDIDGHGICWGENINISCEEIYEHSVKIPLTRDDLKLIIKNSCMDTSGVTQELNCSKQNVDDLVKRNKLHPFKEGNKYKLFYKWEIEKRNWK